MQKYVFNWLVENKELAHLLNKTTRHLMYNGAHTTAQLILLKSLITLNQSNSTSVTVGERGFINENSIASHSTNNKRTGATNGALTNTSSNDSVHQTIEKTTMVRSYSGRSNNLHNLYRKCYPYVEATKRVQKVQSSNASSRSASVLAINQKRQQSLAIRWIVKNARAQRSSGGNSMISKMTKELKSIYSPNTKVYAPVLATHKLAEVGRT